MNDLPPFLQDMLKSCPAAGSGVHKWIYCVARQLHAHMPAVQIISLLQEKTRTCGRTVPESEIKNSVADALKTAWSPQPGDLPRLNEPKWPPPNLAQIEQICSEGFGLDKLWDASIIRLEDNLPHTEEIIDRLFPGNPLLCCGKDKNVFDTKPREQWRPHLSSLQFIVPSPMSKPKGMTNAGHLSPKSNDNTGPRRFLVCEGDFSIYARDGTTETIFAPLIRKLSKQGISVADMCASVLWRLAHFAPLICAVHSGGKSIHGWFYVANKGAPKVKEFFRYACSLGADPATWTPSQFVRMPDGTRPLKDGNAVRQTVYFLQPIKSEAPL